MCLLDKFCCCGLRTGCFVIGALTIVFSLLNLTALSWVIYGTQLVHQKDALLQALIICLGIAIAINAIFLITAIMLIAGANKRRKGLLVPWMVMAITLCVLLVIAIILYIIALIWGDQGRIGYIIGNILEIILMVYCISAVRSFYRNDCQEYEDLGKVTLSQSAVRYDGVEAAAHK